MHQLAGHHLVDVIKVFLGDIDSELIELGHVAVVDHPVSQHALTLVDPQAYNLDGLLVVVLGHTQQALQHHHNQHFRDKKRCAHSVNDRISYSRKLHMIS